MVGCPALFPNQCIDTSSIYGVTWLPLLCKEGKLKTATVAATVAVKQASQKTTERWPGADYDIKNARIAERENTYKLYAALGYR